MSSKSTSLIDTVTLSNGEVLRQIDGKWCFKQDGKDVQIDEKMSQKMAILRAELILGLSNIRENPTPSQHFEQQEAGLHEIDFSDLIEGERTTFNEEEIKRAVLEGDIDALKHIYQ